MIVTVTLNPALDKTIVVHEFAVDRVCRVERSRLDPGGKGINISKVLHGLGGRSVAVGIVGGASGEYIRDQLDVMGIRNDFVFSRKETRTNLKVVDPVRHTTTDINEPGTEVTASELQEIWEKLSDLVGPGDTVAFAGKNPPGVSDQLLAEWITRLRGLGVRTALDTVGMAMKIGVAAGPTVIKPNEAELEELCEKELNGRAELLAAARRVVANGVERVVVSMGPEGALFVKADEALYAGGVEVPVGSTVGAGDAMLASVLWDLERGLSWEETAARAVAVSAASVMRDGTQAVTAEEVAPLVEQVRVERLP